MPEENEIIKELEQNYKDRPENFIQRKQITKQITYVVDYEEIKQFILTKLKVILTKLKEKDIEITNLEEDIAILEEEKAKCQQEIKEERIKTLEEVKNKLADEADSPNNLALIDSKCTSAVDYDDIIKVINNLKN